MSYREEQKQLEQSASELIEELNRFRRDAEAIIMNTADFTPTYRISLKILYDKAFDMQLELKNL